MKIKGGRLPFAKLRIVWFYSGWPPLRKRCDACLAWGLICISSSVTQSLMQQMDFSLEIIQIYGIEMK